MSGDGLETYSPKQLVDALDKSMRGLKLHGSNSSGAFIRGVREAVDRIDKLEEMLEQANDALEKIDRTVTAALQQDQTGVSKLRKDIDAMLEGSGSDGD